MARLDSNGWQWCLATCLGRHLRGNLAMNLHSPLQNDRQVFLHPGRYQGYPKCPTEKSAIQMCTKLKVISNKDCLSIIYYFIFKCILEEPYKNGIVRVAFHMVLLNLSDLTD